MQSYDLTLSDGKTFRCVCLESAGDPAEDIRQIALPFQTGAHLVTISRVVPPIPDKLPWKRTGEHEWRLANFTLTRTPGGFQVDWPGGSASGGRDEIASAVRKNWAFGC